MFRQAQHDTFPLLILFRQPHFFIFLDSLFCFQIKIRHEYLSYFLEFIQ